MTWHGRRDAMTIDRSDRSIECIPPSIDHNVNARDRSIRFDSSLGRSPMEK